MKTLKVNESACIGCGACIAIDPDHFEFNDSGLSQATNNENLDSANVLNAIESCPTNAIDILEAEEVKEECSCEDGGECACGDDCNCQGCTCQEE